MINILFICHGTTLIGWDLPRETTINHDLHWNYYPFTTFLSSDMMKDKRNAVQRGRNTPLSGLLFLCLLFRPKPVLVADEHHINWLSPRSQNRGFFMPCGGKTILRDKDTTIYCGFVVIETAAYGGFLFLEMVLPPQDMKNSRFSWPGMKLFKCGAPLPAHTWAGRPVQHCRLFTCSGIEDAPSHG